jgi:serine/threonine-protein kinase
VTEVIADRLKIALASRYVIERTLGQGGMATVYLARDLRHDRKVALKVLRPELASAIGADRFLNEIRVTASLQHPHILPLHDSGETDGFLYYVMPYVDGESLRDRLDEERQLPIDDAIRIAIEVAAALAYAHGKGVIHRDVKPENILIATGAAVVADFGIARAVTTAGAGRLTQTGLSLGTPHYMSPEQATAERDVDARTDIYALGTVVYEMLVGEPPFTGPTAQSVIAKVLAEAPRSIQLDRQTVPEHVDAAVRKALAKLPADRFRSAIEFSTALTRPGLSPATAPATGVVARSDGWSATRPQLLVATLVLLGSLALGIASWLRGPPPQSEPVVRATIVLPDEARADASQFGSSLALSPDGSVLVYAGRQQLFTRRLDQFAAVPIPNTSGAEQPFFSPDGRHVGFVENGMLKRVPVAGGPALTIGAVEQIQGATWGDNDVIVFARALGSGGSLFKIPAAGGTAELLLADSTGSNAFRWPSFLPGGGQVLVSIGTALSYQTGLVDLKTGQLVRSIPGAGASPHFVEPGWLLSVAEDGTVVAVPFDARTGDATGPAVPVPVLERVGTGLVGSAKLAVSRNGLAVYMEGVARQRRLTLIDRRGTQSAIAVEARSYVDPRFSPNGNDVALTVVQPGGGLAGDIWILNIGRATMSRLTSDGLNEYADWSVDGQRVLYTTLRGANGLYSQRVGAGKAELLFRGPKQQLFEATFTNDEKRIIYRLNGIPSDLYHVHRDSVDEPHPILDSRFDERAPAISPDDRWLAYVSNESGRDQVYVRSFPEGGVRSTISAAGGTEPRWSRNGRELFYRNGDTLFVVKVQAQQTFAADKPVPLFVSRFLQNSRHATYDVHPDGQRFIFISSDADDFGELMLVQNVMPAATRSQAVPANR